MDENVIDLAFDEDDNIDFNAIDAIENEYLQANRKALSGQNPNVYPIFNRKPTKSIIEYANPSSLIIPSTAAVKIDVENAKTWIYPTNFPVRDYQRSITQAALLQNTMVSLPTGLGKTLIAAVVMYNFYRWFPNGKIVFMAPTKPLVMQQIEACHDIMGIPQGDTAEMQGSLHADKRRVLWKDKRVFFCTPQMMQNDLLSRTCNPRNIVCVVFDEAHRATKNYAYCVIIRTLLESTSFFRVLALSATPGATLDGIQHVLTNLRISHIECKNADDGDVKQYVHCRQEEVIRCTLGENVNSVLEPYLQTLTPIVEKLHKLGVLYDKNPGGLSKWQALQCRESYRTSDNSRFTAGMKGMIESDFALLSSLLHGLELLRLHGIGSFNDWLLNYVQDAQIHRMSKTKKAYMESQAFQQIKLQAELSMENAQVTHHPKMAKLREVLLEHFHRHEAGDSNTRAIVFSQYRGSVHDITQMLQPFAPLLKVQSFVGQGAARGRGTKGQTQKEQQEIVHRFREGELNILVATCIAEEGLDIGEVDLIVSYDALTSPVRMIQRMGRTGRKRVGKVLILVTEGAEERKLQRSIQTAKKITKALTEHNGKFKLIKSANMFPDDIVPTMVQKNMEITAWRGSQVAGRRRAGAKGVEGAPNSIELTTYEMSHLREKYLLPDGETKQPLFKTLGIGRYRRPHFTKLVSRSTKSRALTKILQFLDSTYTNSPTNDVDATQVFTNTEMEQCHHIETAVGFIDSSDDEGVTTGSHIPPTKEFENSVSPIFSPIRTPIISPTNKASNIDSQESNLLHDHQLNNFSQPSVYSLHSSDDDKDVTEGIGRLSMTPKEAAPDGQKFDSSLLSISKILSNTSLHSVSLRMPTTGTVAILPTPPFEKLQDKSIKDPLSPLHSPRIRLSVSKALSTPKRFHKSQSPKTSPILVTTKGSKSIDKLLFHQSICMVCLEDDSPEDDPLVRCSGCNKVTHQHCYGIDDRNLKVWECQPCAKQIPKNQLACSLCPLKDGLFKRTRCNEWVHLQCFLWMPELSLDPLGVMQPGTLTALERDRKTLQCIFCFTKNGACVQCNVKDCFVAFHVPCAALSGCPLRQTENEKDGSVKFVVYCLSHANTNVMPIASPVKAIYSPGDLLKTPQSERKVKFRRIRKIKDQVDPRQKKARKPSTSKSTKKNYACKFIEAEAGADSELDQSGDEGSEGSLCGFIDDTTQPNFSYPPDVSNSPEELSLSAVQTPTPRKRRSVQLVKTPLSYTPSSEAPSPSMLSSGTSINSRDEAVPMHTGYICAGCDMDPIEGTLYTCTSCTRKYLCMFCYSNRYEIHDVNHIFKASEAPATPIRPTCTPQQIIRASVAPAGLTEEQKRRMEKNKQAALLRRNKKKVEVVDDEDDFEPVLFNFSQRNSQVASRVRLSTKPLGQRNAIPPNKPPTTSDQPKTKNTMKTYSEPVAQHHPSIENTPSPHCHDTHDMPTFGLVDLESKVPSPISNIGASGFESDLNAPSFQIMNIDDCSKQKIGIIARNNSSISTNNTSDLEIHIYSNLIVDCMPSVRVGILLKRVAELGAFSSLPVLKEEMGIVLDRFSEVYIILEMHQQCTTESWLFLFINTCAMQGVRLLYTHGPEDTASLISTIARQEDSIYGWRHYPNATKCTPQLLALLSIPAINYGTAVAILSKWQGHTLQDVLQSTPKEYHVRIPWISMSICRRISAYINRRYFNA